MSFNAALSTSPSKTSEHFSASNTNSPTLINENFEMSKILNITTMKIDDEASLSPNGDSFIDSRNNSENNQVTDSSNDVFNSVQFKSNSNLISNGKLNSNCSVSDNIEHTIGDDMTKPANHISDKVSSNGQVVIKETQSNLVNSSSSEKSQSVLDYSQFSLLSNGVASNEDQANSNSSEHNKTISDQNFSFLNDSLLANSQTENVQVASSISENAITKSNEPKPINSQSNQVNGHSPIRNGSIPNSQNNSPNTASLAKPLVNGHSFQKSQELPFPLLAGEALCFKDNLADGFVYLTNYRLYVDTCSKPEESLQKNYQQQPQEQIINLPVGVIDLVELRDISFLVVFTKYVQSFILSFPSSEAAILWHKRLSDANNIKMEESFCFKFFAKLPTTPSDDHRIGKLLALNEKEAELLSDPLKILLQEYQRMNFGSSWKICELNKDFKFCSTYPQYFIVPTVMTEDDLNCVANFRYSRRLPVVVWRSHKNGCVIIRSAQPVVGWLSWRSSQDERLLQKILNICNGDTQKSYSQTKDEFHDFKLALSNCLSSSPKNNIENTDLSPSKVSNSSGSHCNGQVTSNGHVNRNGSIQVNHSMEKLDEITNNTNKLLVLDARSYTAALANRAMGGGCECAEYYPMCEIQFMGLNNIHNVRKNFHSLRYLCESAQTDQPNWLTMLDNTKWLHNLAALLKAAMVIVDAIAIQERPVLVHCSDGWDRTPQLVALAELMLDPYYRTIDGFQVLVEREWLQYGHKFTDRCRSTTLNIDLNERCPVFLQWLDCVHQLLRQFPSEFEFNDYFLIKLVYHSFSGLFGSFTCNNVQERTILQLHERTISIWSYLKLERSMFTNYLYAPKQEVLRPSCRGKDISFWYEVYVPVDDASTENVAFNEICNHPVNNNAHIFVKRKNDLESGTWNEADIDESHIEFQCGHEIKCQSLSKCDLNRWASCENVSSKVKSMSPSDYMSNGLSQNTSQPSQSYDQEFRPRIRHLSDSCLFDGNEKPIDRDDFLSSSFRNKDLLICDIKQDGTNDDSIQGDIKGTNDQIQEEPAGSGTVPQHPHNNRIRKMQSNEVMEINENGIDQNGQFELKLSLSHNLAKPFDIDGDTIVKDKSYIQMQQFIIHQKKTIDSLNEQLAEMNESARGLRGRSNKSYQSEDLNCSRKHSSLNGECGNKHLDALDLNSCNLNKTHNLNSHGALNGKKLYKDPMRSLGRPRSMTEGRTSSAEEQA